MLDPKDIMPIDMTKAGRYDEMHKKDLHIPIEKYQRLPRRNIKKIVDNFNWPCFGALIIADSGPDVDPRYNVLDGGHRLTAARVRDDVDKVPVMIYKATIQEQAKYFNIINNVRAAMTSIEKMKAQNEAQDEISLEITEACKQMGRVPSNISTPKTFALLGISRILLTNYPAAWRKVIPLLGVLCANQKISKSMLVAFVAAEVSLNQNKHESLLDEWMVKKITEVGFETINTEIIMAEGNAKGSNPAAGQEGLMNALHYWWDRVPIRMTL